MTGPEPTVVAAAELEGELEGERKQVTILFADIVGSTGLIDDRDEEAAHHLFTGALRVMMDAVHRFGGTVSRNMGDGLLALFGAPIAHEDHAVRACYAALAIQERMRQYAAQVSGEIGADLRVRVGLNSGGVVVQLLSDDRHSGPISGCCRRPRWSGKTSRCRSCRASLASWRRSWRVGLPGSDLPS